MLPKDKENLKGLTDNNNNVYFSVLQIRLNTGKASAHIPQAYKQKKPFFICRMQLN